jgi:hypothetical protein
MRSNYKGIVAYDDVVLGEAMMDFWASITQPKYITDWHFSGLGMVYYGGNDGSKKEGKSEASESEKSKVAIRKGSGKGNNKTGKSKGKPNWR